MVISRFLTIDTGKELFFFYGLFNLAKHGIGGMVMDRLKVLGFYGIGSDPFILVKLDSNISDHVLNKFWIVIGAFCNVLLIWTL